LIISASNPSEIIELKPDKMPVGIFERMTNFSNQTIQLKKGDIFYLLSDGYQDQFGGPKFKKFMSKNLKQLVLENHTKSMNEQREILDNTIENWKNGCGKIYAQTDDISILGVRI
jgi:serine phosphatase RsbU (regulator of sigma subunit)